VIANLTPNADARRVSAAARFALAAVCCGIFVVTVVIFARMTGVAPLAVLRNVSFTFWGVFVNFAVCLGLVAYVSRRLQKQAAKREDAR
jgi:membrane protein implicated in regulation of membrane protease activity